jgi:hypothetical protein
VYSERSREEVQPRTWSKHCQKLKCCVYRCSDVRCLRIRSGQRSAVVLTETGSNHLHTIADEVSRVAELCIGQGMGTLGAATAFMEMEAGNVN